ncbi:MAG: 4Fe-4S dicluster domain-containing protein [Bacteroidia bacterium]
MGISNIIFLLLFIGAFTLFALKIKTIVRNIRLGRDQNLNDNFAERLKVMSLVAIGQSKMVVRPVAGIMHILIYIGFVIMNIELLEIVIDGITGTHRVFAFLGGFYNFVIGSFEFLGLGVLIACIVFLIRRNVLKLKRFWSAEMTSWPRSDANLILTIEILLMTAFFTMNATDQVLQSRGVEHYVQAGWYPFSQYYSALFTGLSSETLIMIERSVWWFHICGILFFLNYVPYSKHFHILLAFPNVFYSNLNAKGKFSNMESVTNEVKLMFDSSATPPPADAAPVKFGAKDVNDLSWIQLMNAYSCTECGRCTSNCPANITGKKLSPRKIMMDTRDRLEEYGKNLDKNTPDTKSLLHDYITPEELWACTSCNACVEACPVNIDPLSIIVDLRRNLVMEESNAPAALAGMFTNVENNGAPWQFAQADRLNWANEG